MYDSPDRFDTVDGVDGTSGGRDLYASELGLPPQPPRAQEYNGPSTDEQTLKTGTTTVGLATEEGVVLATDRRASAGNMVASKDARKIHQIHPTAALTISGAVGAAQSLVRSLRAEVNLNEARRGEVMSMQALSTLTGNFLRSGAFFIVHPILGGVDTEGGHVYNLFPDGSVMEEDYTATGSGSPFALGVLESQHNAGLNAENARTVAIRAVHSATERDTASGNGISIVTITDDGVGITDHEDVAAVL